MSILDDPFKKITQKDIKSKDFRKQPWGSPHKTEILIKDGYRYHKSHWKKEQYFWEYIDTSTSYYYVGLIYYFPEGFEGYVTSFQGRSNTPKHPAGHALITIDNHDDGWYEIVAIDTIGDLDLAKSILRNRIRKIEK